MNDDFKKLVSRIEILSTCPCESCKENRHAILSYIESIEHRLDDPVVYKLNRTELDYAWEFVKDAERSNVGFALENVTVNSGESVEYEAFFFDPWGGPDAKIYKSKHENAAFAIQDAYMKWKKEKRGE